MLRQSWPRGRPFVSTVASAVGLLAATCFLLACPEPEVGDSCIGSAIGCQPGDACSSDADCSTGGDSSATCDATANVCVKVCSTIAINSQLNLDAAKYCREINGDLFLEPAFTAISASDLPYLTRVRGSIKAGSASGNSAAQSIAFASLQAVDGDIQFGGFMNLQQVSFPKLSSVGGSVELILSSQLRQISLPELAVVPAGLTLGVLPALAQVEIPKLRTIGGQLSLRQLCNLPWAQVQAISALGSRQTFSNIGCCTSSSGQACDGSSCTCN